MCSPFHPVSYLYCLGSQFWDNEKRNGVPWKTNILCQGLCTGEVIPQQSVTKNGRFEVAGMPNIVSQDLGGSVGTLAGPCSIVSVSVWKCIQFSSSWKAGEPGTGRVTGGCNYTKSGVILNAELQSWIQDWTEVGSDWWSVFFRMLWNLLPPRCPSWTWSHTTWSN